MRVPTISRLLTARIRNVAMLDCLSPIYHCACRLGRGSYRSSRSRWSSISTEKIQYINHSGIDSRDISRIWNRVSISSGPAKYLRGHSAKSHRSFLRPGTTLRTSSGCESLYFNNLSHPSIHKSHSWNRRGECNIYRRLGNAHNRLSLSASQPSKSRLRILYNSSQKRHYLSPISTDDLEFLTQSLLSHPKPRPTRLF